MKNNREKPDIEESTSKHVKVVPTSTDLAVASIAHLKTIFDTKITSQKSFEIFPNKSQNSNLNHSSYLDAYPDPTKTSTPKTNSQHSNFTNSKHIFDQSKNTNFTQVLTSTPNESKSLSYDNFDRTMKSKELENLKICL